MWRFFGRQIPSYWPKTRSGSGSGSIADDIEGARGSVWPAGVVDGGEGCQTIAGVWVEGNAIERVDVRCPVLPKHLALVWRRRRRWNVSVSRDCDEIVVDVVCVLEFDVKVVFPAVVDRGIGDAIGAEFCSEGNSGAIKRKQVVRNCCAVDRYVDRDQENPAAIGS